MGITYTEIRLANQARKDLEEISVSVIEPSRMRMTVNPRAPNIPMSIAKGWQRG